MIFKHVLLLLILAQVSFCATYYVSKSMGSSDANNGTNPNSAFATVAFAVAKLSSGDTLHISSGVHIIEGEIRLSNISNVSIFGTTLVGITTSETQAVIMPNDKLTHVEDKYRLVSVNNCTNVTFSGLILKNAFFVTTFVDATKFGIGGALLVNNSNGVVLQNMMFEGNLAIVGGAIFMQNSKNVQITGSFFLKNSAVFGENSMESFIPNGFPNIVNLTIVNGISVMNQPSYIASIITVNSSIGGAIAMFAVENAALSNCVFSQNSAGSGASLYASMSTMRIERVRFQQGVAFKQGSAMYIDRGQLSMKDVDFVQNVCQTKKCKHVWIPGDIYIFIGQEVLQPLITTLLALYIIYPIINITILVVRRIRMARSKKHLVENSTTTTEEKPEVQKVSETAEQPTDAPPSIDPAQPSTFSVVQNVAMMARAASHAEMDATFEFSLPFIIPAMFFSANIWRPALPTWTWLYHSLQIGHTCLVGISGLALAFFRTYAQKLFQDGMDSSRNAIEIILWISYVACPLVQYLVAVFSFHKIIPHLVRFFALGAGEKHRSMYIFLGISLLIPVIVLAIGVILTIIYFSGGASLFASTIPPIVVFCFFGIVFVFCIHLTCIAFSVLCICDMIRQSINTHFTQLLNNLQVKAFSLSDNITEYMRLCASLEKCNVSILPVTTFALVTAVVEVVLVVAALLIGPPLESTNVLDSYKNIIPGVAFLCYAGILMIAYSIVTEISTSWYFSLISKVYGTSFQKRTNRSDSEAADLCTFFQILNVQKFQMKLFGMPIAFAATVTLLTVVGSLLGVVQAVAPAYENLYYVSYNANVLRTL